MNTFVAWVSDRQTESTPEMEALRTKYTVTPYLKEEEKKKIVAEEIGIPYENDVVETTGNDIGEEIRTLCVSDQGEIKDDDIGEEVA